MLELRSVRDNEEHRQALHQLDRSANQLARSRVYPLRVLEHH
jgi:hypothetical protein